MTMTMALASDVEVMTRMRMQQQPQQEQVHIDRVLIMFASRLVVAVVRYSSYVAHVEAMP